jgi:class 3 adenylate cyclase/TolB-like protein
MEAPPVARRLAAIVVADVVGYTRLMEKDEAGTHARLREIRDSITDPRIAQFGGRIVKTAGDGMLVEFPSTTAALRCVVEVQREMGHRNLYGAGDAKIEFRVGINLGDILIDGDNIAGDGVNIAARLETLAEPGGICIGSTVYEQVHGDPGFGFVDMGEQQVKNIARPIRAYRVTLGADGKQRPGLKKVPGSKRWTWAARAVGLAAIGVIATLFIRGWPGQVATSPATPAMVARQPPALSIAIMPFAAPDGNPSDVQLSESLSRDVTTALGRSARYARVVAPGLASGYKGKTIDARVVGRELNVRYLIEGEIRRAGDKRVLEAMLIDTGSATQAWTERFDIPDAPVEAGNDATAARLSKGIRQALLAAESRRVARQSGANATATELWLRGAAAMEDGSLQGTREARKLLDEALRLDPGLVGALVEQVWVSINLISLEPSADRNRYVQEIEVFSLRAVAADRNDPRAWKTRADALSRQWRWAEASEALAEVLRIDPRLIYAYHRRALIAIFTGQPEDAFSQLDKAIVLDPRDTDDADQLFIRCRAHMSLGHYDEAINACERSAALQDDWVTYMFLTAAYAQQGQMAKALGAKNRLLKFVPGYTIARMKAIRVSDNAAFWQ